MKEDGDFLTRCAPRFPVARDEFAQLNSVGV